MSPRNSTENNVCQAIPAFPENKPLECSPTLLTSIRLGSSRSRNPLKIENAETETVTQNLMHEEPASSSEFSEAEMSETVDLPDLDILSCQWRAKDEKFYPISILSRRKQSESNDKILNPPSDSIIFAASSEDAKEQVFVSSAYERESSKFESQAQPPGMLVADTMHAILEQRDCLLRELKSERAMRLRAEQVAAERRSAEETSIAIMHSRDAELLKLDIALADETERR